jgi:hypothetical protein
VTWRIANTQNITFTHNLGTGQTVAIDISRDGGTTWTTVNPSFTTTNATTGTFGWVVTGPATSAARARVRWSGNPQVSSASPVSFTIVDRITVTAPNTAVTWTVGSTRSITWNHNLGTGQVVSIDLSRDGGATYSPITTFTTTSATSGTFSWVVTAPATNQARIRVGWSSNPAISDASDVNFTIQ